MIRTTTLLPLAALMLAVTVAGCGPSKEELKIQELTAENEQLRNDLDDQERRFNDTLVRENDASNTIDELNQEIARMHAEASQVKDSGDWQHFDNFDMISVPGEVLFASGKATLSGSGRSTIARLAADIRSRYADRDIYVFGHTDAQPIRKSKWKDNWELGAQRALTVVRTLSSMGIPKDHLVQANCGEYRPAAMRGKANQPQNRRVEFYAVRRSTGLSENISARGYNND